ncbi:50S ribosomal protein L21e [Candidatus Woesearchaeota archaeon]|nr:50S ribosomal protein L21e [Candidatus Woesearchaeota archaeon]
MVKRKGSYLRKTRHKLMQDYRHKGKIPLSRYFQEFQEGDKVHLKINSAAQSGRFHPRFHGFSGTVHGQRGSCYGVLIHDGDKQKKVYVHPIHLQKA